MSEPGFASLGPTLLARKGGAKPAMRPQLAPLVKDEAELAALADEQLEDLGWNDMGSDENDASHDEAGADVVPINANVSAPEGALPASPIVRRQQRRLEERVLADAVMTGPEDEAGETFGSFADESDAAIDHAADVADLHKAQDNVAPVAKSKPAPAAPASRIPARNAQRRAAFTLRLDPERHLKLRLAATMQGVSAQALVTEALDRLLEEFDDLDVIAAHLKRH
jgi:predicted HicB family RNase H-like nuclease